ncbi:ABC transporter ATP-binding protein [Rhodovulum sp. DZ06]|uniref:ABC transporter ATP-binding protein n=1 Tax=Rhodovulum sp. DZ06 TaxID=3425126 RepID=UPI003D34424C
MTEPAPPASAPPVLELLGITKRFGALTANDDVTLTLGQGEILALLGENGAGKTTLMNILFGHYAADEGEVRVFGAPLPPGRPRAAIDAGVGMVHQHFTLASALTVLDNVILGSEPLSRPRSARRAARARLLALSERFGLPVDPDAVVSTLSVGERQRVEILKALFRDARVLILDEPTAVLARPEAERLFATLRDMTKEGLSLIFISHKLHEVMAASDRVAVLRAGRLTAERRTADTSPAELAELMVGRKVERPVREAKPVGAPVVVADRVTVEDDGAARLKDVSFTIHAGEILGIVGVSGNGQASLGALLSGLAHPTAGRFTIGGEDAAALSPRDLIAIGAGRIPEDRHSEGVVGELSVWENAVLERLRDPRFSSRGIVKRGAAKAFAESLIKRFDIRGAAPDTPARLLSGGNMQKLILGRSLTDGPKLVLANQPTRGLDEGAVAAVHAELLAAREAGAAILLISEELEEAVALSDRIQAIVGGRLSSPIPAEQADARRLGLMMAGAWEEAAHAL